MVSVAALTEAPDQVLANVARHVADGEVRRNATLGGNLSAPAASDAQRGDLGAPLIALGARVRSTGAGGERTEPIEDFLAGDRAARLVLEVEYDRFDRRSGASALRRRHAQSYSIADVVACSRADGSELRIGVSGVGPDRRPLPQRRAEPRAGTTSSTISSRSTTPLRPRPTAAVSCRSSFVKPSSNWSAA